MKIFEQLRFGPQTQLSLYLPHIDFQQQHVFGKIFLTTVFSPSSMPTTSNWFSQG